MKDIFNFLRDTTTKKLYNISICDLLSLFVFQFCIFEAFSTLSDHGNLLFRHQSQRLPRQRRHRQQEPQGGREAEIRDGNGESPTAQGKFAPRAVREAHRFRLREGFRSALLARKIARARPIWLHLRRNRQSQWRSRRR